MTVDGLQWEPLDIVHVAMKTNNTLACSSNSVAQDQGSDCPSELITGEATPQFLLWAAHDSKDIEGMESVQRTATQLGKLTVTGPELEVTRTRKEKAREIWKDFKEV